MARMKKQKASAPAGGAGLIRYFDAEEKTSLRIPPWLVIGMCVSTILVITIVNIIYKV